MIRLVTVALLLSAISGIAAADEREAVRAACKSDVATRCGTLFSRAKVIACLIDNAAKLSAGCTTALKAASCNAKAPGDLKAAFPCAE